MNDDTIILDLDALSPKKVKLEINGKSYILSELTMNTMTKINNSSVNKEISEFKRLVDQAYLIISQDNEITYEEVENLTPKQIIKIIRTSNENLTGGLEREAGEEVKEIQSQEATSE